MLTDSTQNTKDSNQTRRQGHTALRVSGGKIESFDPYPNPVAERERSARKMFEQYCKEGIRPMMYDLTQLAAGGYVSCFTQWAWKIYWKGINDSDGAW
jgi:hypothetical protein